MSTIEIGGRGGRLIINLLRYESDSATDDSDANWLVGELEAHIVPFSCHTSVTFTTHDLARLLAELKHIDPAETTELHLASEAETLMLSFEFDPHGAVTLSGTIQTDYSAKTHLTFELASDRWFTAKTIEDLELAVSVFPVREVEKNGYV